MHVSVAAPLTAEPGMTFLATPELMVVDPLELTVFCVVTAAVAVICADPRFTHVATPL